MALAVTRRFRDRPVTRSLLWAFAGTAVAQGSVLAVAIVQARLLGRTEFGKLAILQMSTVAVSGVAALGLGVTATRFVARLARQDPARVGRILGLCQSVSAATGLAFAGALLLAAPRVAALFHLEGLEPELRLSSVQVLFLTLNAYQVGALSGFSAFAPLARVGLVQAVLGVAIASAGTWAFGLGGAVLALGIAAAASWTHHQIVLRDECRRHGIVVSRADPRAELGVLWRFALPSAVSGWGGGLAVAAAGTLLVRQADGPQSLAIFNAASSVRVAVLFLPALISRVSAPVLCGLAGTGTDTAYRRAFWRSLASTVAVAAGAAALLGALGPWILWLFGKDFTGGGRVLAVLMAAGVLEATSVALFQAIYARGLIWRQVAISTLWGSILVATTWGLGTTGGAMALALAYLAAWGVSTVLYGVTAASLLREPSCAGAPAEVAG